MNSTRVFLAPFVVALALMSPTAKLEAAEASGAGFPSAVACHFMDSMPLMTLAMGGAYSHEEGTDEYLCGTTYFELVGTPANTLSYYASGNATTVRRMRLLLNVNDTSNAARPYTMKQFEQAAGVLYQKAYGQKLPKPILTSLTHEKPGQWTKGAYTVSLEKESWPSGGYELNFVVMDKDFKPELTR